MMKVITCLNEWKKARCELKGSVGLVPTMGNLHKGHASLIRRATEENDITVLTIFVNQTQFNNPDDFKHYPKTLEQDLEIAKKAGADVVLMPTGDDIYPDNFNYKVCEDSISSRLEGTHRPGHFTGVLTVVLKLLMLVRPHRAYFGEKDYQQYQLIAGMSEALFLDIDIIPCETTRDADGLAFSSRNNRLTDTQRQKASLLPEYFHDESLDCETIAAQLQSHGFEVDYIEEYDGRRFAAVFLGDVRLIDNFALKRP
jgi:pantoate--beta-alanine ligase